MRRPLKPTKVNLNLQPLFTKAIEECSPEILKYLNSQDISKFKAVCKVTFYFVQSYQIWNMMMQDNDKGSQASTKDDSMLKDSFLKQSFYSKLGKVRPQTEATQRTPVALEQWLTKPANYSQKPKKLLFLTKKNLVEESVLNDEDLKSTADLWALNLKKLERNIKIDMIETDSLMQEISLWQDNVKVLQELQSEIQLEHAVKIMALLKQRAIGDVSLERKFKIIEESMAKLFHDFKNKKQYATAVLELKPILQKLLNLKLAEFNEFPILFWGKVDQMLQDKQLIKCFSLRSEHLLYKTFQVVLKLMNVQICWIVDFQIMDMRVELLESLSQFLNNMQKRHSYTKDSIPLHHRLNHTNNANTYKNYKTSIDNLIKMSKLNRKLYENQSNNLSVQQFFTLYKNQDYNDFGNSQKWSELYRAWKDKYQQQKQQHEEKESEDAISFGFYQTQMSWSIK